MVSWTQTNTKLLRWTKKFWKKKSLQKRSSLSSDLHMFKGWIGPSDKIFVNDHNDKADSLHESMTSLSLRTKRQSSCIAASLQSYEYPIISSKNYNYPFWFLRKGSVFFFFARESANFDFFFRFRVRVLFSLVVLMICYPWLHLLITKEQTHLTKIWDTVF